MDTNREATLNMPSKADMDSNMVLIMDIVANPASLRDTVCIFTHIDHRHVLERIYKLTIYERAASIPTVSKPIRTPATSPAILPTANSDDCETTS